MSNETVVAPSQPESAPSAPETKGDAPKSSNLSVAEAAARLLNIEAESAKAKAAQPEQTAQEGEKPASTSEQTEAAQAESAEPEAPAEAEAQAEEEAEKPEDVPSHDLSPEQKKRIEKRIGKEVAKRKALEAQLNELKVEIAKQQAAAQTPTTPPPLVPLPQGAPPLAQIEDVAQLSQLSQQAKEAKRFAEEQLDRDDFEPVKVGDNILDRAALKTIIRNANKTLEDDIPQRFQFLQQRNQAQQVAYEKFPFLKDKSAPEYVMAQQALLAMPWLRNLPNSDWIIGVQIEGIKALQAREASKGKAAKPATPVSKKPPTGQTVVSSSTAETRTPTATRNQASLDAMRNAMSKKGGVTADEAAKFLLARELAKTTR